MKFFNRPPKNDPEENEPLKPFISSHPARLFSPGEAGTEFHLEQDRFSRAQDFPELFASLRAEGNIRGSQKSYGAEELVGIIMDLRRKNLGQAPLDTAVSLEMLPRTGGLRQRVTELLRIEQLDKGLVEGTAETAERGKILQDLEQSIAGYRQRPSHAPFTGQDAAFAFKGFVDKVDSLVQSSLSREEARHLLTIIKSFPGSSRYQQDELRLKPLQDAIERIAQ